MYKLFFIFLLLPLNVFSSDSYVYRCNTPKYSFNFLGLQALDLFVDPVNHSVMIYASSLDTYVGVGEATASFSIEENSKPQSPHLLDTKIVLTNCLAPAGRPNFCDELQTKTNWITSDSVSGGTPISQGSGIRQAGLSFGLVGLSCFNYSNPILLSEGSSYGYLGPCTLRIQSVRTKKNVHNQIVLNSFETQESPSNCQNSGYPRKYICNSEYVCNNIVGDTVKSSITILGYPATVSKIKFMDDYGGTSEHFRVLSLIQE